ncbi:MAG: hypothetical protein MI741_21475, partial [Rhodospirillales bacterium]|nr:hypothetical protein [Rhodospirillales bacterium]
MDDFEDTTTQGWRVGAPGGGAQPINVSTGGPNGAGDAYLQYSSAGGGGPLSRLVFFNDSQWTGDFIGEGITQITADVNNLGSTELELRLAFGTGVSGNSGSWFVSTDSITLP